MNKPDWMLPDLAHRLDEALAGNPSPRSIDLHEACQGEYGILELEITRILGAKTFQRRDGSEGQRRPLILSNGVEDVEWTLWDEDIHLPAKEEWRAGTRLAFHGAAVVPGWRGGWSIEPRGQPVKTLTRPSNPEPMPKVQQDKPGVKRTLFDF